MNARFFKTTTRARTKLTPLYIARQTGRQHQFRSHYAAQLFRVDAQIHVLKERYTSQRPTRRALPSVQIELWVNFVPDRRGSPRVQNECSIRVGTKKLRGQQMECDTSRQPFAKIHFHSLPSSSRGSDFQHPHFDAQKLPSELDLFLDNIIARCLSDEGSMSAGKLTLRGTQVTCRLYVLNTSDSQATV